MTQALYAHMNNKRKKIKYLMNMILKKENQSAAILHIA
jgi:hypothetical protein